MSKIIQFLAMLFLGLALIGALAASEWLLAVGLVVVIEVLWPSKFTRRHFHR